MDRLYQERMARLVLDRLLESGELRSVASQRALSLRIHYLPANIRFEVPAEDDFLPLLDPKTRERAASGLRDALIRVVEHEEADHWVIVDPNIVIDVALREGSRRARVQPVYEAELASTGPDGSGLGEPRLQIQSGARRVVFRQRQGLLKVDLGPRTPGLVVFEADDEEDQVAWLYATGPVDLFTDDGRERYRPRTRIPIERDVNLTLRPHWTRPWQRRVPCEVQVLGLARAGRREIILRSDQGATHVWDRNRDQRFELGPDFLIDAGELDQLTVHNTGDARASIRWFDGRMLEIPPREAVTVQGAHFLGLTTPGGVAWTFSLPEGSHAPAPRVIRLVGERLVDAATTDSAEPSLFRFEQAAARVVQSALVLPATTAAEAAVAVRQSAALGPLAEVALDDCAGAKLRLLMPGGTPIEDAPWQHIHDVARLDPSSARLEVVDVPSVIFEGERPVRALTTDPSDQLRIGGWRVGLTVDGLTLVRDGGPPIIVDGVEYAGSARIHFREAHRLRAGDGIYRILRKGSA